MLFTVVNYVVSAYVLSLVGFILYHLLSDTPERTLSKDQNQLRGTGITFSDTKDQGAYIITHTVEDGIERIVYTPKELKHATPILMAHGMWHGALCWKAWQEIFAANGWESVAYSLPGHGKSPVQRSLTRCTLGYYLAFVRDEINRLPIKPILMGHSMGGALSQWVLRYISSSELPAVVLVAPWVYQAPLFDRAALNIIVRDPIGILLMYVYWNANSWVRTPDAAASKLISRDAILTPEALHQQLVGESALVIFQHHPPFWNPARSIKSPMLILAGESDAVVSVGGLRKTAAHYKADLALIPRSAHNLMMEKTYRESAATIEDWLIQKKL